LTSTALLRICVGVLVERHKANSPWLDFVYRPASVLTGVPAAEPWTLVSVMENVTTFYAGEGVIELYRTETASYRDNLATGTPLLWVILRPTNTTIGFELLMVTADPAEGEALTGAGEDLVGTVPMPHSVQEALAAFIAEHHVEQAFVKRQRQNSTIEGSSRRAIGREDKG
jgi:hypothetical protein